MCNLVTVTIAILRGQSRITNFHVPAIDGSGRVGSGLERKGEYIVYFLFFVLILPLPVCLYFMVKTLKAKPVNVGNITVP